MTERAYLDHDQNMKYVLIAREDEVQASFLSRLLALHQRSRRAPTFTVAHARGRSLQEVEALDCTLLVLGENEAEIFFKRGQCFAPDMRVHGKAERARVIWLRESPAARRQIEQRAIHSKPSPVSTHMDWMSHVDLVLDKKDLSVVSSEELVLFFGLLEAPVAQLDGVATLGPELFFHVDAVAEIAGEVEIGTAMTTIPTILRRAPRAESWIQRQLSLGCRWVELRSDLLSEAQLRFAANGIPPQRILWSVRDDAHAPLIQKLQKEFKGDVDWTLKSKSITACWLEPRFLSIRERQAGESVSDVLKRFPRMIEEGTQLHAEFEIHSLEELVELENWRRAFSVARVTNPVSNVGRWQWFRLLRGIEHPLSYYTETQSIGADARDADRPGFLQWVRRRQLQKSERNRHGQIFFAAHIFQITEDYVDVHVPVASELAMNTSHPHYHAEFFARFAAPMFEVKLTANELRKNGLASLSGFGLRWAQLDPNLAILEDANTWVCDHATLRWRGKWIDVTPREDFIANSMNLVDGNSKVKRKPVRAQHDFWNRPYEEPEE